MHQRIEYVFAKLKRVIETQAQLLNRVSNETRKRVDTCIMLLDTLFHQVNNKFMQLLLLGHDIVRSAAAAVVSGRNKYIAMNEVCYKPLLPAASRAITRTFGAARGERQEQRYGRV
ncbi:hypothetical protein EVAR_87751_1 [Eumeta japonica]|uniref:Uncharacterized protein n=1 Tax=Eumeta variegata TaxID=151549 RepID=A0A4C1ZPZ5_EUMVA|nr:hypothetical protein EVAR_87751_1 [Eumeta japonica]